MTINRNLANVALSLSSTGITSSMVTGALGFTPISGIDSSAVTTALGYTPATNGNAQITSLGVGTAATATTGEIRATNNITGYYTSDKKFKENVEDIQDALDIVDTVGGKTFDWTDEYINDHGGEDGYFVRKQDFGVIAQDVQSVFPLAIRTKPDGTLAVDYEKLCAISFAAIKELKKRVEELEGKIK